MSTDYRELLTVPNPTGTSYGDYVARIEEELSKLADADVYKGDRGESLKVTPISIVNQPQKSGYLYYTDFNDIGKQLLDAIFDDIDPEQVFVVGGEEDWLKKLDFFRTYTDSQEIQHNGVDTWSWWCVDGNPDTDKQIFPSTTFIYIDPNAHVKNDSEKSSSVPRYGDYSCILSPRLIRDEEESIQLIKSEVFPSFWYNPDIYNGKGGWCWKINGVNTDIPASAANNTDEYSNKLFLIKKKEDDSEYLYYTASDDGDVDWYTLADLKTWEKRIPIDGDLGYLLSQVSENDSEGEDTDITVLKIATYINNQWQPAQLTEGDAIIKYNDVFMSYVWDCISFRDIITDKITIGTHSSPNEEDNKVYHTIEVDGEEKPNLIIQKGLDGGSKLSVKKYSDVDLSGTEADSCNIIQGIRVDDPSISTEQPRDIYAIGSHIEGFNSGVGSNTRPSPTQTIGGHAEGFYTQSLGNYSHTEGDHTISVNNYSSVCGRYNNKDADSILGNIFTVGCGTDSMDRENGFAVNSKGGIQLLPNFIMSDSFVQDMEETNSISYHINPQESRTANSTVYFINGCITNSGDLDNRKRVGGSNNPQRSFVHLPVYTKSRTGSLIYIYNSGAVYATSTEAERELSNLYIKGYNTPPTNIFTQASGCGIVESTSPIEIKPGEGVICMYCGMIWIYTQWGETTNLVKKEGWIIKKI